MKLLTNLSYFSEKLDLTLFRRRLRRLRKKKNIRSNNNKKHNMELGGQCSKIRNILSTCISLSFVTDIVYYYASIIGFRFHKSIRPSGLFLNRIMGIIQSVSFILSLDTKGLSQVEF